MCGIAGYVGTREIPEEAVKRCLQLMGRRGPDRTGWERISRPNGEQVTLLHSRLSIIDLDERSSQPFHDGPRTLVYNGELYNYVELAEGLRARGHSFRTTSDTEVLIKAVGESGAAALDRCEGMWAFALYDRERDELLLSRDRFGEKPLYLYRDETGFYFGSEAKFIVALLGRRLPVNYPHLYRYLVNGYKDIYKTRDTFFVGLEELPPATTMAIGPDGKERRSRYWEPRFEQDESLTYEDAVAQVREALLRTVKFRLRADVPLAFCMSGGVDSNTLIAIASRVLGYDVHGFTIANSDARYEEDAVIAAVVRELNLRHTSIPVDVRGFLPRLRSLINYHDAPVYTITYYAHWLLMESIAAHGYKISLSGTAADELFSGYFDHHLAYLHDVRYDSELHARSLKAWQGHIQPLVRNPFLRDPDLFVKDPGFRDHIYLNAEGFAEYLKTDYSQPFTEKRYTDSLLRNRMLNEMFQEAVPVILHEDDLNAMYYSIENRSPFLDRELFEICYQIPTRYLVREGRAKAVLRDSMRGIVPDVVLDNPRKVGFNAPIHSFLDVSNPEVRAQLLDESPVFEHIQREKIEELIERDSLPNSESKFLFYFLTSKLFLEEFGA